MRTRTLLLLAIGCGLVILIAGGVQLLRLGDQQQTATLLRVGERGAAGDAIVELVSSTATDDQLIVTVRVGGVDDSRGVDGFTLVGPGRVATATSSSCDGVTVAVAECELRFDTAAMQGSSRQLLFRRADQQLRWVLAQGD